MRISRVALGDYPYPAPVKLYDGRVVDDPANNPPSAADCVPFQCGADPANMAARMYCSYYGHAAAYPCSDAQCAPYPSQACALPQPAPTPLVPAPPPPKLPVLTPISIQPPGPSITEPLTPAIVAQPECSFWCDLNGAIAAHPVLAVAVLVGLALCLLPKGGR